MKPTSYNLRNTAIQAFQFNGLDDYLAICNWLKPLGYAIESILSYQTPNLTLTKTEQWLEGDSIKIRDVEMEGRPGSYVVLHQDGYVCVMARDIFETLYVEQD